MENIIKYDFMVKDEERSNIYIKSFSGELDELFSHMLSLAEMHGASGRLAMTRSKLTLYFSCLKPTHYKIVKSKN
jgi:hypothetical protein